MTSWGWLLYFGPYGYVGNDIAFNNKNITSFLQENFEVLIAQDTGGWFRRQKEKIS